jgi:hypothetical protein
MRDDAEEGRSVRIILISGKARHGKDTTAEFLKSALESDGYSVLIAHYGDLVKYICKTFFGWDGNKDESGRTLLQYVGTDIIRNQDENYWVRFIAGVLGFFKNKWDYVLIPDCRFPNEIDYIKEMGFDASHVRVIRENFESSLTPEQQMHPSETALDNVRADYYIINNGTKEVLQNKITQWVAETDGFHQIAFMDMWR